MSQSLSAVACEPPIKVAIVTSMCGGSQVAAKAIEEAVKAHFPNRANCSIYPIDDLWPGARFKSYEHYLTLAERGCFNIIYVLALIQQLIVRIYATIFANGIEKKVFAGGAKPDILISTTPYINSALIKVAKRYRIPFFVLTSDMDSKLYAVGWPHNQAKIPPHRYGVYYSCHEVATTVPTQISRDKLVFTGGFIKEPFTKVYTPEEKATFRDELRLPKNKKIVSLMMGSLGGRQIADYVDILFKTARNKGFQHPVHFVVFCGKNEALKKKMEDLAVLMGFKQNTDGYFVSDRFPNVSFSFLGFSNQVHKYYALSSGLITKPGAGSVNEAVAQNLPLLLDDTDGQFPWEKLNGKVVELYGLGSTLHDLDQLPDHINMMFLTDETNDAIREKQVQFQKDRPDQFAFGHVIGETVKKLLDEVAITQEKDIDLRAALKELLERMIQVIVTLYNLIAEPIVQFSFFSEFLFNKSALQFERKKALLARGDVTPIEKIFSPQTKKPIDALMFKAPEGRRTGNIVFMFLAKPYQQMHPKNIDHLLADGTDVVLFNPTYPDSITMAEDAKALIQKIRQDRPKSNFLFHGYCIGAHVALRVAKDLEEQEAGLSIPLVIDRGFESSYALARKVTFLSLIGKPLFRSRYDLSKDQPLRGRICFIGAEQGSDQLLHDRKGRINFLDRIQTKHSDEKITLPKGFDHYSKWDAPTHNKVKKFMNEEGFLQQDYRLVSQEDFPTETKRSFARRVIMPMFI